MIVKKKEWDKLINAKETLEKEHSTKTKEFIDEISNLKKVIRELESKNTLNIRIYKVEDSPRKYYGVSGYYNNYDFQIDNSELDLSIGVKSQILRIIRKVSDYLFYNYKNNMETKDSVIRNLNDNILNFKHNLEKLPYFTTRNNVIKLYNNSINESN